LRADECRRLRSSVKYALFEETWGCLPGTNFGYLEVVFSIILAPWPRAQTPSSYQFTALRFLPFKSMPSLSLSLSLSFSIPPSLFLFLFLPSSSPPFLLPSLVDVVLAPAASRLLLLAASLQDYVNPRYRWPMRLGKKCAAGPWVREKKDWCFGAELLWGDSGALSRPNAT
jgi:hypothetical protein